MSNERETRYAAALWNAQAEWWRDGTLPEDFADFARAVMPVADEERAGDRAKYDALVADLRGLADEWNRLMGWPRNVGAPALAFVLDKHAG